MGGQRKARGFYMNKLPQQIPCRKPKEELPRVPLTADGIKRLGGIDWATRKVSRLLGYKVEIYETEKKITVLDKPEYIIEGLALAKEQIN